MDRPADVVGRDRQHVATAAESPRAIGPTGPRVVAQHLRLGLRLVWGCRAGGVYRLGTAHRPVRESPVYPLHNPVADDALDHDRVPVKDKAHHDDLRGSYELLSEDGRCRQH